MNKNLITPAQLADRWSIGESTLGQWRWNGRGPQFLKLGKRIMYRPQDIEAFEVSILYESTSQYGREV